MISAAFLVIPAFFVQGSLQCSKEFNAFLQELISERFSKLALIEFSIFLEYFLPLNEHARLILIQSLHRFIKSSESLTTKLANSKESRQGNSEIILYVYIGNVLWYFRYIYIRTDC